MPVAQGRHRGRRRVRQGHGRRRLGVRVRVVPHALRCLRRSRPRAAGATIVLHPVKAPTRPKQKEGARRRPGTARRRATHSRPSSLCVIDLGPDHFCRSCRARQRRRRGRHTRRPCRAARVGRRRVQDAPEAARLGTWRWLAEEAGIDSIWTAGGTRKYAYPREPIVAEKAARARAFPASPGPATCARDAAGVETSASSSFPTGSVLVDDERPQQFNVSSDKCRHRCARRQLTASCSSRPPGCSIC